MIARLRSEEGSALVTAIVLVTVMVMLGLAVYAMADTEQKQAGQERVRESAFVVAEAALDAQVLQLSRTFPLVAAQAYPAACTATAASSLTCPDPAAMAGSYNGGDYATTCNGSAVTQWVTSVRDNGNGAEKYYSRAIVDGNPPWDANADGALWVRAEGAAGCRARTIVTLVASKEVSLPFPRNVVTANWFRTTNMGKKVIVDTEGKFAMPPDIRPDEDQQSSQPADLAVRCDPPPASGACLGFDPNKGQVAPNTAAVKPSPSPMLSTSQIDSIRALAKSLGTYYTGCPPTFTGKAVFIESLPDGCSPNNGAGNTADEPGMLVVASGVYRIGGNAAFYGVIYMLNQTNITGPVVELGGTSLIQGAVSIDGPGGLSAGASKTNLIFDPRSQSLVKGLGAGAAVPNTWRELPRGQ